MITAGTWVIATDANGKEHRVRATSGVVRGRDFPVVWVALGMRNGARTEPMPWPAEYVREAPEATS